MLTRLPLALLLLSCFCFSFVHAQTAVADTTSSAVQSVIQQYKNKQGDNLLLYNGIEYARSYLHTTGTPFLFSDSFPAGSVVYDGVSYQNVPLNYDIAGNCVVIKNKDNFLIELVNGKIGSFVLNNRQFVSLTADDLPKSAMSPGIYEVYDFSPAAVFISYQKVVQRAANAADLDHFTEFREIYLKNGSDIFRIKNNKELLAVFSDQQKAISSYLRQNNLSYKRNPEETVVKAAAYYAQIKQ